jgi:hypothetical protein
MAELARCERELGEMKNIWTYEPDGDLEEYDMTFFTSVRVAIKVAVDMHLNKMKPGDKIEVEINVWRPEKKQDGERIQEG